MQIMKLSNTRKPGPQHVCKGLGSNRSHVIGSDLSCQPVHGFAPAPEGILAFCDLTTTGQASLKTVTVGIRHAWQSEPSIKDVTVLILDADDPSLDIDSNALMALDPVRGENMSKS